VKAKSAFVAMAVLAMWGMKRFYADAGADDLHWILAPTARLVSAATGAAFVAAPGEGYFSRERLFLIEKSCAGINFMIAAFAMLTFMTWRRTSSLCSAASLLAGCAAASYATAVLVNAARISAAVWLAGRGAVAGLPPSQVHRVEGIAVYFGALIVLHEIARRGGTAVPDEVRA
jgi:exosortase K